MSVGAGSQGYGRLHWARVIAVLTVSGALAGCAAAPSVVAIGYAVDGASFLATGKGLTDHTISAATHQDCAMLNVLRDGSVCRDANGSRRGQSPAVAMMTVGPDRPETPARPPEADPETTMLLSHPGGWAISGPAGIGSGEVSGGDNASQRALSN